MVAAATRRCHSPQAVSPPAGDSTYILWDLQQRQVLGDFPVVIAASADQIAWTDDSCNQLSCPLHLTDIKSGSTHDQPLPGMPTSGAYSPDGAALALFLANPGPSMTVDAYLVDGQPRTVHHITGTTLETMTARPTLSWSSDGRWLLITSFASFTQAGLVDAHTKQLYVATLPAN